MDLKSIKDPSFVKKLNIIELNELASDIRSFLVDSISKTGGHLASNLGVVELTIAMHYVFDSPKDRLLFDVGHQSYVHKILTGRAKDFINLRKLNGLNGFIDKTESAHDIWESGHSSSTLSAQAGILASLKEKNDDSHVVSVIGDASISNGVSFEALNFLGASSLKPIIILNDNKMGIDKTVGALANILNTNPKPFFEQLGFKYLGPIDGSNLEEIISTLNEAKRLNDKIIVHVLTHKGAGYLPATNDTIKFHGLGKFDPVTGEIFHEYDNKRSFSEIVSDELVNLRENKKFTIINPAMLTGSELVNFKEKYPNDCYDVGISEEHALDMAAGMALNGSKVVVSLYSTFSQRAFDQMLNDISRQKLNVVLTLDRAGVVGKDGATHQGIYDLAMLRTMPYMVIAMGSDASETKGLLEYALNYNDGPIAIRFPRIRVNDSEKITINNRKWVIEQKGSKAIIITYGPDVLRIKNLGLDAYIINARFLRPLDKELLRDLAKLNLPILVYEQVTEASSLAESIVAYYHKANINNVKLKAMNFDNNITVTFGDIDEVLKKYHLADQDIIKSYEELICD